MKQDTKLVKAIVVFGLTGSALLCSGNTLATSISLGDILVNGNFQAGATRAGWLKSPTHSNTIKINSGKGTPEKARAQQFTDTAVGIDNVAVNAGKNNVPKPSMFDLLGLGFAIFAATQKKRLTALLA